VQSSATSAGQGGDPTEGGKLGLAGNPGLAGRARWGWLFAFVGFQVIAAGFISRGAAIVGMHLAGQAWDKLRLSAPYLSQTGELCAGLVGGALVGLAQWLPLRRFSVPPRWMLFPLLGGLFVASAGLVWPPLTLLAAPIAGGLAGRAQLPLLPRRDSAWPKAQALAASWTALALLLPFPPWAAAAFILGAALLCAAGIRRTLPAWRASAP
jgi:hypothetical protein